VTEFELTPQRHLTSALSSAVSIAEVANAILVHGLQQLEARTVSLWLVNEDGTTLDYVGGAGAVLTDVTQFASMPLDADLPGPVVVSTGEPIIYRSTSARNERWPELAPLPSASEASAVLPMQARDEMMGCLSIGYDTARDIGAAELMQLMIVADQCALALDRARLVERERRARETLEFLSEATSVMVSALDAGDVLDQLTSHAVPTIADWCGVWVHDGGYLRRTALKIAGADELAQRLLTEEAEISIEADVPMAQAWRTGEFEHVAKPGDVLIDAIYREAADAVRAIGLHDIIVCPILARGLRLGVITFSFTTSNRRYTPEVFAAAVGLAARAGVALDIAQRFERERTTAATLVAAMLPERLPAIAGWSIVARYLPAGDAVCGDWYDVTALPGRELLVGVGDSAGHGLPAAALMAELRNAARGLAIAGHQPGHLLDDLSVLAEQNSLESFATAAYGRLDPTTGAGTWSLAGHPPPLVVPARGRPRFIQVPTRPALGVPGGHSTDCFFTLEPGDTLLLYTDGLIERRGELLDVGFDRLARAAAAPVSDAAELADRLIEALCADLRDDCCLLVLHRHAPDDPQVGHVDEVDTGTSP
jgi:GAF domain-containing protein